MSYFRKNSEQRTKKSKQIFQAHQALGPALWTRFHETDPQAHAWYYRQMGELFEPLGATPAWQEYWRLYHQIWPD